MDFGDLVERAGNVHASTLHRKERAGQVRRNRSCRLCRAWLHYDRRMAGYPNAPAADALPPRSAQCSGPTAKPLVIDLRPPEDFAGGSRAGAVHLDLWGVSLIDTDPAPLKAFMWMIDHLLQPAAASTRRRRWSCTTSSRACAPRALSGFSNIFGHPCVQLLDGGFSAWMARGPADHARGRAAAGERVDRHAQDGRSRPGGTCGTASAARTSSCSTRAVMASTTAPRCARSAAAPIPGAVHVEWTRNLGADGAFKPAGELRAMYEEAGVTPDKEVVTYCQGGYRAAHAYLALRLLGYPRVRNYTGSWKEWGDREDLPGDVAPIRRNDPTVRHQVKPGSQKVPVVTSCLVPWENRGSSWLPQVFHGR